MTNLWSATVSILRGESVTRDGPQRLPVTLLLCLILVCGSKVGTMEGAGTRFPCENVTVTDTAWETGAGSSSTTTVPSKCPLIVVEWGSFLIIRVRLEGVSNGREELNIVLGDGRKVGHDLLGDSPGDHRNRVRNAESALFRSVVTLPPAQHIADTKRSGGAVFQ